MSTPDFEQMATSLYDAMGRGPEADIKCIAAALRLARAQALEEAAGAASMFSINKTPIHPDVAYDRMNETAKMVSHTTCQQVAEVIRTLKAATP